MHTLGQFVEWVRVCPEIEVGMGVPRESVRLVDADGTVSLVGARSGTDWTTRMQRYGKRRVRELGRLDLCGFVLKKDSPSCGMERVRVYAGSGQPRRDGRGAFAEELMRAMPLLPVEEEGRLTNPKLRENFLERVFAYDRWRQFRARPSPAGLVAFHARHKMLLLSHSDPHLRRLGRIVATADKRNLAAVYDSYGEVFMTALQVQSTVKKNVNVLQHIIGFFTDDLSDAERAELHDVVGDYHRGLVPLVVPITLVRHYVRKHEVAYIGDQVYLNPHPKELMLRNHA